MTVSDLVPAVHTTVLSVIVHMFPRGWPRFGREQNFLDNGSLHRRFGYIFQRILFRMENRIAGLEKEFIDLEFALENDPGSVDPQSRSPLAFS